MSGLLTFMLVVCGVFALVLVVLVIYGNALDSREEEEIYVNKEEEKMMAGDQAALVERMNRLAGIIKVLAIITGVMVIATAGVWIYTGLYQ